MKRLLWILVIALWGCILVSALSTRPVHEDYCYAVLVRDHGVVGTVVDRYTHWAGRYSQQFFHAVLAQWEPYGAAIGIPVVMSLLVLSWWYALARWYSKRDALLLALALGGALVMSRPNDGPIFWVEGLTTYVTTVMAWGLLIGAVARKQTMLATGIAFFGVAFSEIGAMLIVLGLGLVWYRSKSDRRALMPVLIAAGIGTLILLIAPGNAVRASVRPETPQEFGYLAKIAVAAFATTVIVTAVWSFLPGLFASGLGAEFAPRRDVRRLPMVFIGLVLGVIALLSVISTIIFGWSFSEWVFFFVMPFWLALYFFFGALIGQRFRPWRWLSLAGVVLVLLAAQHAAGRVAFAAKWDARDAQIRAGYRVVGDLDPWDTLTSNWAFSCAQAWYGRDIRVIDENVP